MQKINLVNEASGIYMYKYISTCTLKEKEKEEEEWGKELVKEKVEEKLCPWQSTISIFSIVSLNPSNSIFLFSSVSLYVSLYGILLGLTDFETKVIR